MSTQTTAPDFGETLSSVSDVEGWMTDAQARRLWDAASRVGAPGRIVEIGSFRGRSTIVLARAAADVFEVVAIDPHGGGDRGPQEISPDAARGEEDFRTFHANLQRAGVDGAVRHVRRMSDEALGEVEPPIDLLYVDGAHRFGPARADLVRWGARVPDGGRMLVHDAFSSVGVTLALLTATVPGRRWRYLGREGSLAAYVRERSAGARELAELPWFAGNLVRKGLIAAGLRDGPWPH
jgi:hypothetical protein